LADKTHLAASKKTLSDQPATAWEMPSRLPVPSPARILIWHQGALGDLLLAGPALAAVSRHYPGARLIGVGQPGRWRLLAGTLPLAFVWDGGEAVWSGLFQEKGALSPPLLARLAGVDLALVFSPRPRPGFLARLVQGGVGQAFWVPSFPEDGCDHVATVQARRLRELGVKDVPAQFRLVLPTITNEGLGLDAGDCILALGPGSGSFAKNWPLSHYYEVARALAWDAGLKVVWLAGPAEAAMLPYLQGLAEAQGQVVWASEPLERVAALLSRTRVYVGGDSGLTHLAAAAGAHWVVALFGPTDPRVWAPIGEQVAVLTPPGGFGPNASLADLTPSAVLAAVRRCL
jgi:heptosyltransferase-2